MTKWKCMALSAAAVVGMTGSVAHATIWVFDVSGSLKGTTTHYVDGRTDPTLPSTTPYAQGKGSQISLADFANSTSQSFYVQIGLREILQGTINYLQDGSFTGSGLSYSYSSLILPSCTYYNCDSTYATANTFNVTFVRAIGGAGPTAAIPEPSTWALLIAGLGAVGFSMRRRGMAQTARAVSS